MEDDAIIRRYLDRDPSAIRLTQQAYGGLCRAAAARILSCREDQEECVNDALLALWNTIPPQRPRQLGAYLNRITRNLALKRWEYLSAEKRGRAAVCSLTELEDCLPGEDGVERQAEGRLLAQSLSAFLRELPEEKRLVFLRRYYFFDPIEDICARTGFSKSKVTSMLFHLRNRLRDHLTKEELL